MIRKVLILLAGIAVSIGLLAPIPLAAQTTPSATRSFDATSVAPGGSLDVTITVDGQGTFGSTWWRRCPPGSRMSSSVGLNAQDYRFQEGRHRQVVTFSLLGRTSPTTFTYTVDVAADHAMVNYTFSGDFSGVDAGSDAFSGVYRLAVIPP